MNDDILIKNGVILKGHFLLTSGNHSDVYFEKFRLLETPYILEMLVDKLLECCNLNDIDYAVGPAVGGMIIAYEFARRLKCKSAYLEKRDGIMGLYRDTPIGKDDNVIIVDDVLTTGKSINESIKAIKKYTQNINGIFVLIDRSDKISIEYPLYSAIKVDANIYSKEQCPLCKNNIELIRPGGKR